MEKALKKESSKTEIESVKSQLRNPGSETRLERHIKEFLTLKDIPNRTEKQEKALIDIQTKMAYITALDYGTLLQIITSKDQEQHSLIAIRERLIKENNCTTAIELMLTDQIAAAYWRLMKYEFYACRLPSKEDDGWSFDQLKVNVLKEVRQQIEQAHRQINMALTQLKDLKQPPLKVNVKADSAYFAQNQQVINEKPKDEPPIETIKPK